MKKDRRHETYSKGTINIVNDIMICPDVCRFATVMSGARLPTKETNRPHKAKMTPCVGVITKETIEGGCGRFMGEHTT